MRLYYYYIIYEYFFRFVLTNIYGYNIYIGMTKRNN